jgi:hypothetical protein
MRELPEINAVYYEKFNDYLINFRKMIQRTLDNDYKEVLKTSNSTEPYFDLSLNPFIIKEETQNVYRWNLTCEMEIYALKQNSNEPERLYYT